VKHILLLEDHSGVADLLARLLEEEHYYVSCAIRIADAQVVLEQVKVDLLIADIILPDGTAFGLVEVAKKRRVPYLLMTGSIEHMAQLEANGEFHLAKPFKVGSFIGEVRDRIGPANGKDRN
jgi:two-component system OmpR family response regulator